MRLSQLDSISQAADHYLNAIEAFYEEADRIDRTIEFIQAGDILTSFSAMVRSIARGWYLQLNELPEGPESRYLYHVARDARVSGRAEELPRPELPVCNLDAWQQNAGVYSDMLETRIAGL